MRAYVCRATSDARPPRWRPRWLNTSRAPPRPPSPTGRDTTSPSGCAQIIDDVRDPRRRRGARVLRRSSTRGRPRASASTPSRSRRSWRPCPTRSIEDIDFVQDAGTTVRAGAARLHARRRDRDAPGRPPGPPARPHLRRRRLRPRRALPPDGLGPHDRRDGQGRRRRARRGLHAADPRRDPGGHDRRDEPGRRRRDLRAGRRAGGRRHGGGHRDDRPRRLPRRSRQRLRRGGQAPALRRGRHRPVRRPHGDPRPRRRRRRPVHLRGRPALPGRARPRLPRRARDHVAGARPRRSCGSSTASCPGMPTKDFAEPAWRDHGQVVVVDDMDELWAVARLVRLRARPGAHRRTRARRSTGCATTARSSSARTPASPTATR